MRKVPKLRFKEFSDEWEEKKLGEISEVKDGTHDSPKYIEVGFPLITSKNVKKGKVDLSEVNYISKEDYDSINRRSKVSKGDILMGMIGTIGNLAIVDKEDFAIKNVALIKEKKELKNIFLIQFLESDIFKKKISLSNEGGTQKFISLKNIRNFTFFIPQLHEQEKIANFLSSVDKKISLTEEKLELFRKYKKGVMQKIFSQKLRFKDSEGNDYPEWEEKKLGEICKICTGKLDANAMVENGKYRFYTCAKEFYYIDNYSFDTEALLISGNGANVGYIHYYKGKFNAYQRTYVLDSFEENIIFIKYILERNLRTRIEKEKNSGNTPYIVLSVLTDMILQIPFLEEQQKIADFLSSIDNKIENMEKELKGLKKFKKGLLQQMFI